jgi:hypothetical protein
MSCPLRRGDDALTQAAYRFTAVRQSPRWLRIDRDGVQQFVVSGGQGLVALGNKGGGV